MRVFSIFRSIQGESTRQGLPCVFVRLAGCPLHCRYCDTREACESPGVDMSIPQIVKRVEDLKTGLVEITGGEPLIQRDVLSLMTLMCESGYEVLLETSGALSIEDVDPRVHVVLDVKCPDSGMSSHICWENFESLVRGRHELKFVISSRKDFDWMVSQIHTLELCEKAEVLVSPVVYRLSPADLVEWVLESGLMLRLQIQLHKAIWDEAAGER